MTDSWFCLGRKESMTMMVINGGEYNGICYSEMHDANNGGDIYKETTTGQFLVGYYGINESITEEGKDNSATLWYDKDDNLVYAEDGWNEKTCDRCSYCDKCITDNSVKCLLHNKDIDINEAHYLTDCPYHNNNLSYKIAVWRDKQRRDMGIPILMSPICSDTDLEEVKKEAEKYSIDSSGCIEIFVVGEEEALLHYENSEWSVV